MPYTEPELIRLIKRLVRMYVERYPEDKEPVERFLSWILQQWGYEDGKS